MAFGKTRLMWVEERIGRQVVIDPGQNYTFSKLGDERKIGNRSVIRKGFFIK